MECHLRRFSSAAVLLLATIISARADQDVLLTAVSFVLTGYDTAHVEVVDRANCTFMINGKRLNGRLVGEVFHLNNIDVDRLTIEDWHDAFGTWFQVNLRGEAPIYEYTGLSALSGHRYPTSWTKRESAD